MATSGFTNFIDCSALKIYALPEAEISVTNGIVSRTLGTDDVFEIKAGWKTYVVYIQQKDFGTWTVVSTIGNTNRQKSVVIDRFSLYTIDFILPNEYKRLDYITFPSGAYINTGLYANAATDGIFTEIKAYDPNYIDDMHYIGTNNTGYGAAYHVTSYSNKYYYGYNNNGSAAETSSGAWAAGIKIIKYNNKVNNTLLQINDIIYNPNRTAPLTNYPILIGRRYNGTNFKGNIYYCLMKNNTTLQYERKLYPARRVSDSVLGMYDVITDTFYTNSGSGTFIAGAAIDGTKSPLFIFLAGAGSCIPVTYGAEANASISVNRNNITTNYTSSGGYQITYFNTNPIDLSKYSKLVVIDSINTRASSDANYAGIIFAADGLPPSNGSGTHTNAHVVAQTPILTGTNQTTILNLNNINTNGYVGLRGGMKGTISQIYLI